jgi:hypothetical protein
VENSGDRVKALIPRLDVAVVSHGIPSWERGMMRLGRVMGCHPIGEQAPNVLRRQGFNVLARHRLNPNGPGIGLTTRRMVPALTPPIPLDGCRPEPAIKQAYQSETRF